jgi:hypothetical protein
MPNVDLMQQEILWLDCLQRKSVSEYWVRPSADHSCLLRQSLSSLKHRRVMCLTCLRIKTVNVSVNTSLLETSDDKAKKEKARGLLISGHFFVRLDLSISK